jgi:hypothetical protein
MCGLRSRQTSQPAQVKTLRYKGICVNASRSHYGTVNDGNTHVGVAAGGFEGTTHPSFVFTIRDSGFDPVSAQRNSACQPSA